MSFLTFFRLFADVSIVELSFTFLSSYLLLQSVEFWPKVPFSYLNMSFHHGFLILKVKIDFYQTFICRFLFFKIFIIIMIFLFEALLKLFTDVNIMTISDNDKFNSVIKYFVVDILWMIKIIFGVKPFLVFARWFCAKILINCKSVIFLNSYWTEY